MSFFFSRIGIRIELEGGNIGIFGLFDDFVFGSFSVDIGVGVFGGFNYVFYFEFSSF